jgi:hypothetical protein
MKRLQKGAIASEEIYLFLLYYLNYKLHPNLFENGNKVKLKNVERFTILRVILAQGPC